MKKVRVFALMMHLMLLPIVALFAGCQADNSTKLEFKFCLNIPSAFEEIEDFLTNIMVNEIGDESCVENNIFTMSIEAGSCVDLPTFQGKPTNANSDISQYFLGWYVGTGINETKITSFTPLVNNNEMIVAKWDTEKINDEFVLFAKLTSRVDDTIYIEGGSALSIDIELSGVNTIYWKANSNNVTCPDNFQQVVSDKDGYLMFKSYDSVMPATIIATLQIGEISCSDNTNSVTATLCSQNNVAGDKIAGEIYFNISNISSSGVFVRLKIECNSELEIKGLQSGWTLIDGYYYFGKGSSVDLLTKIYSDTRQDFCSGICIPDALNNQGGSNTLKITLEAVVATEDNSALIWNNSNN